MAKLQRHEYDGKVYYYFFCQACDGLHHIRHDDKNGWTWNGDSDKVTFHPSIKVTYNGSDAGKDGAPNAICHFFVKDGKVAYCSDCTHALKGRTTELEHIPPEYFKDDDAA